MPLAPDLLDLHSAATAIGVSYDWMTRTANRNSLYARGFPRPLNRPGRKVWLASDVTAWRARPIEAAKPKPTPRGGRPPHGLNIVDLTHARNRLNAALQQG